MSIYLGDTPLAHNAVSRNIGEIIQSTIPLSDAGLHLLDGALISGAGSYAKFVTYIAGLVSNYPDLFETEANWQTAVTTYGVCGKFVYDSVNNTVRLPKITGFTEGTTDVTALGDLVEAGLPNITGSAYSWGWAAQDAGTSGAFTVDGNSSTNSPGTVSNPSRGYAGWLFDASDSNSIYGNSSTVQPQSIKVLYYIVIANSTKTDIQVDIDEVMTDLNGKADVDLSNVNASGTALASGWSMPSSRYITLTLGATSSRYTAPANGYFSIGGNDSQNVNCRYVMRIDSTRFGVSANTNGASVTTGWMAGILPVRKGDIVSVYYNGFNSTGVNFIFVYAEGEENV